MSDNELKLSKFPRSVPQNFISDISQNFCQWSCCSQKQWMNYLTQAALSFGLIKLFT